MNAYDRYKAAQAKRVAKGISKMVKVADLEFGMWLRDHSGRFDYNEAAPEIGCGNVVRMVGGHGFSEKLDTLVEVTIER